MPFFDLIDLEPVKPKASEASVSAQVKIDGLLTDALTDSELCKEYLGRGEITAKSLANLQKELYRFLMWCKLEAGKTLHDLRVPDINAYKAFLKNPPADWVSHTKWPRMIDDPAQTGERVPNPLYRPFCGPLSVTSQRQAVIAVKAFLSYATKSGYLRRDPGSLVKNVKPRKEALITRYLPQEAIDLTLDTIESRAPDTLSGLKRKALDKFLFITYSTTGVRLNEIVTATMGSIETNGDGRWWLWVLGKGSKERRVPVEPEMLSAFHQYREAYGLLPYTHEADDMPLILAPRLKTVKGVKTVVSMTDESVGESIKAMFAAAAEIASKNGDMGTASKLKHATTHWLRHSMLTMHANNDVQLKTLQDTAGHADISTTARYVHKSDNDRHDELLRSRKRVSK